MVVCGQGTKSLQFMSKAILKDLQLLWGPDLKRLDLLQRCFMNILCDHRILHLHPDLPCPRHGLSPDLHEEKAVWMPTPPNGWKLSDQRFKVVTIDLLTFHCLCHLLIKLDQTRPTKIKMKTCLQNVWPIQAELAQPTINVCNQKKLCSNIMRGIKEIGAGRQLHVTFMK